MVTLFQGQKISFVFEIHFILDVIGFSLINSVWLLFEQEKKIVGNIANLSTLYMLTNPKKR